MPKYHFEQDAFVIEQFHEAKPFASFLPGLAGLKGIPMWTFYVNRGQAVSTFGIRDKNSAIMEFSPANVIYKTVSTNGFRTFIKIEGVQGIYEPFQTFAPDEHVRRVMRIRANELSIEETHAAHGLRIKVVYFNVPNDDYAALVRHVEVTNISGQALKFELLDGMPEILPYGVENGGYKEIGNLLRSWMEVYNLDNRIPYYKVRSSTHDEAEVSEVENGHFYLSFGDDERLIPPLVDAELVFGGNTSLSYPNRFAANKLSELLRAPQYCSNKVPCGFSGMEAAADPGQSVNIYTLIGHVSSIEKINRKAEDIRTRDYIVRKRTEANALIDELTADIRTKTASPLFDAYGKQCYLDNLLRGGYPFIFEHGQEGHVVHLYSRKHGDLERDYNFFSLAPEYYSQGNGNFRDANQNRRNDVFFNPKVGTFNIRMFFSLMQADGYNPLGVEGCTFEVPQAEQEKLHGLLESYVPDKKQRAALLRVCEGKFTPGKIINFIADRHIALTGSEEVLLQELMRLSEQHIEAEFKEGYWSDHWTYNMDLVDGYLHIFPDKKETLLFADTSYMFFDSPIIVQPRSEKYVLSGAKVRQYGAVKHDEEKKRTLGVSLNQTNWLRTEHGRGEIYRTNLFVKMLSLSLNKFTCLDPYGMGVEMEANKPGWNDAMNGLPGLFGSGMSETFELKRLVVFLLRAMEDSAQKTVRVPEEIAALLETVDQAVTDYTAQRIDAFRYWDRVASARESYRAAIRFGITGIEQELPVWKLRDMYAKLLNKIDEGIGKAVAMGDGLVPTYFRFEAEEFEPVLDGQNQPVYSEYGLPKAKVKRFKAAALPYFLEGPTRWMKTLADPSQAKAVYERIRKTDLYDPNIKMYKTSVSLEDESHEIGRIRAFTPGWLERESNFLHMSYKYVLELLKNGLYEEYAEEIRDALVPFLDPQVYGRSTLENSSFIAPTVNPDPAVHGRGFYARLSGSTAEFLSMWIYMMAGKGIFRYENQKLQMELKPVLPSWLFDEQGQVSFTFLGKTRVTYHNTRKADTYGPDKAVITRMILTKQNGDQTEVSGSVLGSPIAEDVRSGAYSTIDAYMD